METNQQLWMVVVTTSDHPGDTAAIASVFSGRGLQIDSFVGFGSTSADEGRPQGRILITFYAFAGRCQALCRILESLEAVVAVQCYAENTMPSDLRQQALALKQHLMTM